MKWSPVVADGVAYREPAAKVLHTPAMFELCHYITSYMYVSCMQALSLFRIDASLMP